MELNPGQQQAVDYGKGPLLIAAGAGSGKTRTLTSRLMRLIQNGVPPKSIIAITFTNKAAQEMRNRVNELRLTPKVEELRHSPTVKETVASEVMRNSKTQASRASVTHQLFIGTFHSLGARILKENAKLLGRTSGFTIFDDDDSMSLMKRLVRDFKLKKEQYKLPVISPQISRVKSLLIDPAELLDNRELAFFEIYEEALKKNNAFDFDDLIEKVVRLFKNHPAVLEKYEERFKYILVDEYQDVNTAQYVLIKLLAQRHKNINVVGDDSQAIYGWRHADYANFLNFEADWPEAKIVKLEQNYRSTKNIITAASQLISHNKFQLKKDLWTENHEGELIKVVMADTAEEEAEFIAEAIKQPTTNNQQLTTSVLYRTNAQSRALEQAFIQYNIPYRIFGGVKFYERKEIKDIVAALRVACNPRDEVSAARILNTLPKDIARDMIAELKKSGQEKSILELINLFLINGRYFDYLEHKFKNAKERIENINEFISFAGEFSGLSEFLERVSLLQSADMPNQRLMTDNQRLGAVNLMTIHLAKGLEFDNVFVAGVNEGLLPHQLSYGVLAELEEERRLMYVAMTRAKKDLYLSFYRLPSRFLYEIPPELTEFTNLAGPEDELPDEEEIYID